MSKCMMCHRSSPLGLRHMRLNGPIRSNGLICAQCRNRGEADNLRRQMAARDARERARQTRAGVPSEVQHGEPVSVALNISDIPPSMVRIESAFKALEVVAHESSEALAGFVAGMQEGEEGTVQLNDMQVHTFRRVNGVAMHVSSEDRPVAPSGYAAGQMGCAPLEEHPEATGINSHIGPG